MATMATCFKSVAQTVATVWFEYLKQWPLFWNSGHCFKYSLVLLYEPYRVISAPVSQTVATVSNRGRDYSVGLVEMYQRNSGHCFKQRLRLLCRARRTVPTKSSKQEPRLLKQEPRLLKQSRDYCVGLVEQYQQKGRNSGHFFNFWYIFYVSTQ